MEGRSFDRGGSLVTEIKDGKEIVTETGVTRRFLEKSDDEDERASDGLADNELPDQKDESDEEPENAAPKKLYDPFKGKKHLNDEQIRAWDEAREADLELQRALKRKKDGELEDFQKMKDEVEKAKPEASMEAPEKFAKAKRGALARIAVKRKPAEAASSVAGAAPAGAKAAKVEAAEAPSGMGGLLGGYGDSDSD
jgi:hypothetical protein